MKEDKYWNFSKGERYATIIFAIATIVTILCVRLPINKSGDNAVTERYSEEIRSFEEKLSIRDTIRTKPVKRGKSKTVKEKIVEQKLTPKIRENNN